jgi:hypothetical protein
VPEDSSSLSYLFDKVFNMVRQTIKSLRIYIDSLEKRVTELERSKVTQVSNPVSKVAPIATTPNVTTPTILSSVGKFDRVVEAYIKAKSGNLVFSGFNDKDIFEMYREFTTYIPSSRVNFVKSDKITPMKAKLEANGVGLKILVANY